MRTSLVADGVEAQDAGKVEAARRREAAALRQAMMERKEKEKREGSAVADGARAYAGGTRTGDLRRLLLAILELFQPP